MEYQEMKDGITNRLNSAAEDFFTVGYYLRKINESQLYKKDNYASIWEFAKGEFGLSTSSASRFMAINARFGVEDGEQMEQKYIGMGVSRLQEMLGLPDEELEKVTKETTVREIRAMKAAKKPEPLSCLGFPKTVRPDGSLLTAPGCGEGKYSCFLCSRECEIRQEDRHCRTAPIGNPFPCAMMAEGKRKDIEAGMFSETCQHIHPELTPIYVGSNEPDPCCLACEHRTCFSRCDVAKKKDEDEKKKELAELQKKQKEAEAKKPDMTRREIEKLYEWLRIRTEDTITAASLKDTHGRMHHGNNDFTCSPKGVRTMRSKEMTWAQAAKALKEVQEEKKGFKTEKDLIREFYQKETTPRLRTIIAARNREAITKAFKREYGSLRKYGNYRDGSFYHCYPDMIVFNSRQQHTEQLQITWGRFVTKLLNILNADSIFEKTILQQDRDKAAELRALAEGKGQEVIDVDFEEVTIEPELPAGDEYAEPENAKEESAQPEAPETEQETEPDKEKELALDPEYYELADVEDLLSKYEDDLKAYREARMPEAFLKKKKIMVDALTCLVSEIREKQQWPIGGENK